MTKLKIMLGLALAFVMCAGLWACSDDEPAKDKTGVEGSEVAATLGVDYWTVTDTKVVAPDGKEYSSWSDANLAFPDGILPMLGLRIDGEQLRLFTRVARFCYADFSVMRVEGKTMYLDDNYYNTIKIESVDDENIVVSYWHDQFYINNFNTEVTTEPEIAKGAYMKSTLRRATPEEKEKMENAIDVLDAYH